MRLINISIAKNHERRLRACLCFFALRGLCLVLATFAATCIVSFYAQTAEAQKKGNIFKVSKFAVEAEAADAVKAKAKALREGELAAFQFLLKRLTAYSYYSRLPKLQPAIVQDMIDGFVVRSERNSATKYLAVLDYRFNADAVKKLLRSYRIPLVEQQAPRVTILPLIYIDEGGEPDPKQQRRMQRLWRNAWLKIDSANAIAPMKIVQAGSGISAADIKLALEGDQEKFEFFRQRYKAQRFLLAIARFGAGAPHLGVDLIGLDSYGAFSLKRKYFYGADGLTQGARNAAHVSHAILEGRWKAARLSGQNEVDLTGEVQRVEMTVAFNGFREWQVIRKKLAEIPGVENMDVGSLSARGAEVSLEFPGGVERLSQQIAQFQMGIENINGAWILRAY